MVSEVTIKERELEKAWEWCMRLSKSIKELQKIRTEVGNRVEKLKQEIEKLEDAK
jgi:prefoldin subunit 5